jgi:hypothetical protein
MIGVLLNRTGSKVKERTTDQLSQIVWLTLGARLHCREEEAGLIA